jgi:hypothetical protein
VIKDFDLISKKFLQLSCILYVDTVCDFKKSTTIEQISLTVFCLILTSWSLFSYKMVETPSMTKFSLSLLIPTLICIELLDAVRYYTLTYTKMVPYFSYGVNFLERQSTVLLLTSSFIYFISAVIKLRKINLRNSAIVKLKDFSQKVLDQQGGKSSFDKLITFIYETFFHYFQYIMLLITILISMIEVNFLNFALIMFCVGVISRHKSSNSTLWVYYVFFIDLCILVK